MDEERIHYQDVARLVERAHHASDEGVGQIHRCDNFLGEGEDEDGGRAQSLEMKLLDKRESEGEASGGFKERYKSSCFSDVAPEQGLRKVNIKGTRRAPGLVGE